MRSFEEYAAYLKFHPDDKVLLKVALALREMKRYAEAEDYLKNLSFNSAFSERARTELFKTYFIEENYGEFFTEYKYKRFLPEKNTQIVNRLFAASQLLWSNTLPDSIQFVNYFEMDIKEKVAEFYNKKHFPDYKDAYLAAGLSAVVPGLGKIYTGDYGDGIIAFLFTSVLGYIAYDNFNAGHNFRAWLFTGLTALFYGGNVYGSYTAAQIYNASYDIRYEENLRQFIRDENYFDNFRQEDCND